MRSRASALTASTARNRFGFFFLAISPMLTYPGGG